MYDAKKCMNLLKMYRHIQHLAFGNVIRVKAKVINFASSTTKNFAAPSMG